ncbi:hypothetical protein BKA63DRAFT_555337 [Paraphoma chrysanthemicola]|nr:hypothetical protein BKA63DRAFT_555337 [Paraphoma chrysanthemicola]
MKAFSLLATLLACALPPAMATVAQIIPCTPGAVYCGWYLIDAQQSLLLTSDLIDMMVAEWSSSVMATDACNKKGWCNGGDAWNTKWKCNTQYQADPIEKCGGANSCAGPTAHCA